MNNRDVLHLGPVASTTGLARWRRGEVRIETIRCDENSGHQRGGKRIGHLSVDLPEARLDDFLWTWYSDCLIQERVEKIFRRVGITGYELRPARLYSRDKPVLKPAFQELIVTGWAGVARRESGIKLISECRSCGHRVYSCFTDPAQLIDWSQWDGSDFFMVWPLPRFIFATSRAVSILRDEEFSGLALEAIQNLKCGPDTLTPGGLLYWMPEDRARQVARGLDIL